MSNALASKHLGVRNIVPLVGIMALRHEMAGGDDFKEQQFWKCDCGVPTHNHISDSQYKELVRLWSHEAKKLAYKRYLDPKGSDEQNGVPQTSSKLGSLLAALGGGGGGGGTTTDTLETRTKAWFKAYADWLNFTEEDAASDQIDDASLFEAGV